MSMGSRAGKRPLHFPIGDSLSLADVARDPFATSVRLRREEPVTWLPKDQVWLVAPYAFVDEVHRDQERFTTDLESSEIREIFGVTMLTVDGPAHRVHRRPFDRTLRYRHINESYAGLIRSRAAELLRSLSDSTRAELMSQFADPLGSRIVGDVLGFDYPDEGALGRLLADLVRANCVTVDDSVRGRAAKARKEFGPQVLATLERARRTAPDSVLGTVARERDSALSDELIIDNTVNLLFGGADPVAILVGTTLWALLSHPDQLAEVRQDRSLIERAVDEAARWHPPFGLSVRYAACNTSLGAAQIRAGEKIYAMIISANRDEGVFRDPERFDIHRDDLRLSIAFGRGLHFCIGQSLTRVAAREATDVALTELPALRLDPGSVCEPRGLDFHRLERLDVLCR